MSSEQDAAEQQRSDGASELDQVGSEAIERFVRLMHDAGYDLDSVSRKVREEASREHRAPLAADDELTREPMNVPHMLTLWYTESAFLDEKGNPRALPQSGPGESVESLLHQVSPSLSIEEGMHFLLRTGTLAEKDGLYLPRKRTMSFKGTGLATRQRHLRIVVGLMRTCHRNDSKEGESWYEFAAENSAVPTSAVGLLRSRTFKTAEQFLADEDDRMHRAAALRTPGEPVTKRFVGVFEFEETRPPIGTADKDSSET